MHSFRAELGIIDGNPFVLLPDEVLEALFEIVGRDKGPIPIRGAINGETYQQTLMKFAGAWRLYVNMKMLPDSPRRVGEMIDVEVAFDPTDRSIEPHPKLVAALAANNEARVVFDGLSPSRQKEIVRYIDALKSEAGVDRNVARAINFLLGNERFVGRDRP